MIGIDESLERVPVSIAFLTVSTNRNDETDHAGRLLSDRAKQEGHLVVAKIIVPHDRDRIEAQLRAWINNPAIDVVIATGGVGITGRDVTPEAFFSSYEKDLPGFGELVRQIAVRTMGLASMQLRATAGVANATLLFALPGSVPECREIWEQILRQQLDSRYRPSNLVELLPRLREQT